MDSTSILESYKIVSARSYMYGDLEAGEPWRDVTSYEAIKLAIDNSYISKTILVNSTPIGIMVVTPLSKISAMVTMVVSDRCVEVAEAFSETVGDIADLYPPAFGITKLYTMVDSTNEMNIKWVERFGFIKEFVMTNMGDEGQDMIGYSRTVKEV